eukprot:1164859-Amphidinium_carterae.2
MVPCCENQNRVPFSSQYRTRLMQIAMSIGSIAKWDIYWVFAADALSTSMKQSPPKIAECVVALASETNSLLEAAEELTHLHDVLNAMLRGLRARQAEHVAAACPMWCDTASMLADALAKQEVSPTYVQRVLTEA